MSITDLDYEQTLSELQALMGEVVVVSAQDAGTEYMGLTLVGQQRSAPTMDLGALDPDLLGDFAGETLTFAVGEPGAGTFGSFSIWREGFEWGRRVEQPHGASVSYQVAGLRIFVRPLANWVRLHGAN